MCRQASLCAERDNANARRASVPTSPVHPRKQSATDYSTVPRTYVQKDKSKENARTPSLYYCGRTRTLTIIASVR